MEDHKKFGGDVENDIACQYLKYFEFDDQVLNSLYESFSKGEITCSEMKKKLTEKLVPIFKQVTEKRNTITKDELMEFYKIKDIALPKPKEKEKTEDQKIIEDILIKQNIDFCLTYHNPIVSESDYQEIRSRFEGVLCKVALVYEHEKFFLIVNHIDTIFNQDKLKPLAKKLGFKKLSYAKIDTLKVLLKCESIFDASIFGLVNDQERKISEIWLDARLSDQEKVNFTPLRKDAKLTVTFDGMLKFIIALSPGSIS